MQRVIFYLIVLITSTIFSQTEDKTQAKATVDTFFEGLKKGDTAIMKSVMSDKIILQTVFKTKEGKSLLRTDDPKTILNYIATKKGEQKWDERLLSYNIQIDGNMANVWTPYEFWLNDTFSHCGVNSFQLFKNGDKWEIIYLIDTRRRTGCEID